MRAAEYLEPLSEDTFALRPEFLAYMFTDAITLSVQTVVFARNVVTPPLPWFDESFTGGEDLDLFYRLAATTKFVFVDQIHTFMRVHRTSLTVVQSDRCTEDAALARRINLARAERLIPPDRLPIAREAVSNAFYDIAQEWWERGHRHVARDAWRSSWQLHRSWRNAKGYLKTFVPRKVLLPFKGALSILIGSIR